MKRLWFVTNPASGSTTIAACEALEALFEARGLALAGRTRFPDDALPDIATLDAADTDTLVLFAGDGTINAAVCRLADWGGTFLILPGGTMNLLARALHDTLDPHAIVSRAGDARPVALPFVEAGPHRAFVGLVLGPAAHWFRAREATRKRRPARLLRAVAHAWRRSFGRGVRIAGAGLDRRGYQAVYVTSEPDAMLAVAAIDARDWQSISDLGWTWLTGDWVDARAVDRAMTQAVTVLGTRPVLALFDGEPQMLDAGTQVKAGTSRPMFLSTRARSD